MPHPKKRGLSVGLLLVESARLIVQRFPRFVLPVVLAILPTLIASYALMEDVSLPLLGVVIDTVMLAHGLTAAMPYAYPAGTSAATLREWTRFRAMPYARVTLLAAALAAFDYVDTRFIEPEIMAMPAPSEVVVDILHFFFLVAVMTLVLLTYATLVFEGRSLTQSLMRAWRLGERSFLRLVFLVMISFFALGFLESCVWRIVRVTEYAPDGTTQVWVVGNDLQLFALVRLFNLLICLVFGIVIGCAYHQLARLTDGPRPGEIAEVFD